MTNATTAGPHCECCGRSVDPFNTDEGYTHCCNELVCYGDNVRSFGTPERHVSACCWAMADKKFGPDGAPDGSCQL